MRLTVTTGQRQQGDLVYRQRLLTRITHWSWVVCLFFLVLSGLQIFNAHPSLYIGNESGFGYQNAVLEIGSVDTAEGPRGETRILGHAFDTTGVLGVSGAEGARKFRGFPSSLTIPSNRDLASGRVIHFFFAWLLVTTLFAWLIGSAINSHLRRDLLPSREDLANLPKDVLSHLRFRVSHNGRYNVLQKLAYCGVLFGLFPLLVLTGLCMSPGFNAGFPWLLDVFGGRQTARTLHFVSMSLLVLFFVVHILMVIVAGPLNELRSMITGWYRTDARAGDTK